MAVLRLEEIARMTGGRILRGSPAGLIGAYGIDSRLSVPGELFFALAGERDGHDFVRAAAERGAAGAVVSRPVPGLADDFALVRVEDTLRALQDLAAAVLRERPVRIVGITGSIGKTTTKEFAAAFLSARFRVLKSEGNFNNRIGLALSVLKVEESHEVAVLEMGMSAPGEIRALTRIAPPDVSVITNVAPVHLEFFDSVDGIGLAKREILEGTDKEGTAVLNGDDPIVRRIAGAWEGRRITFGMSAANDVRALGLKLRGFDGMEGVLRSGEESAEVLFPFVNESYVLNLLAAAAVGRACGLSLEEMAPAIAGLRPAAGRGLLVRLESGIGLYDDSYNSNPRALEAALKSLAVLPASRKVAVLGDMLELGPGEQAFHREAGEAVVRWRWDVLVTVGPLAGIMAEGAAAAGMDRRMIKTFADSAAAADGIESLLLGGDLVLVKGSRGAKMEKIVARLKSGEKG